MSNDTRRFLEVDRHAVAAHALMAGVFLVLELLLLLPLIAGAAR